MTPDERAARALPCNTWDEGPTCEGRFGVDLDEITNGKWQWCENCQARDRVAVEIREAVALAEEKAALSMDEEWLRAAIASGLLDAKMPMPSPRQFMETISARMREAVEAERARSGSTATSCAPQSSLARRS